MAVAMSKVKCLRLCVCLLLFVCLFFFSLFWPIGHHGREINSKFPVQCFFAEDEHSLYLTVFFTFGRKVTNRTLLKTIHLTTIFVFISPNLLRYFCFMYFEETFLSFFFFSIDERTKNERAMKQIKQTNKKVQTWNKN